MVQNLSIVFFTTYNTEALQEIQKKKKKKNSKSNFAASFFVVMIGDRHS